MNWKIKIFNISITVSTLKPPYILNVIQLARKELNVYEKNYPNDDRPRRALQAVEKYVANQNQQ